MKKRTTIFLSVFILMFTAVFVMCSSGTVVSADETEANSHASEVSVTTTTTTTTKPTTTTTTTQKTTQGGVTVTLTLPTINWGDIGERITGSTTTTTTTTTAASTEDEKPSEDVSEDSDGKSTTKKKPVTTTKKITTTIKKMTIPVIENTNGNGETMDPLDAYHSRLSEAAAQGITIETDESNAGDEEDEEEDDSQMNPIVAALLAVLAIVILTCGLTFFFSWRNKRLAAQDSSNGIDDFEGNEINVPLSSTKSFIAPSARRVEPTEFVKVKVENEPDDTDEPESTDSSDTEKKPEASDTKHNGSFEDFFSGRDDLD